MHPEWIEFLKRANKSKDFDQIKTYYIPRKLRRHIRIKKRKLEENEKKKEREEKADNFMIVQTEEEFNEKCRQNPPEMKNGHYLIKYQSNPNHLLWRNSNGPISTPKKYLLMN